MRANRFRFTLPSTNKLAAECEAKVPKHAAYLKAGKSCCWNILHQYNDDPITDLSRKDKQSSVRFAWKPCFKWATHVLQRTPYILRRKASWMNLSILLDLRVNLSKRTKWHLREPIFQKFPGGGACRACPRTPLETRAFGAREFPQPKNCSVWIKTNPPPPPHLETRLQAWSQCYSCKKTRFFPYNCNF